MRRARVLKDIFGILGDLDLSVNAFWFSSLFLGGKKAVEEILFSKVLLDR